MRELYELEIFEKTTIGKPTGKWAEEAGAFEPITGPSSDSPIWLTFWYRSKVFTLKYNRFVLKEKR